MSALCEPRASYGDAGISDSVILGTCVFGPLYMFTLRYDLSHLSKYTI